MNRFSPLLSVLFLVGLCSIEACAPHVKEPALCASPPPRVILFIPGYKGSALRDQKTNELAWVSFGQTFWGDRSLIVSPSINSAPLRASGVLLDVPIFGSLFRKNVYGDWVSHLERMESPSTKINVFAYDWRQDNVKTASELADEIDRILQSGTKTIDVVAHSMGALVLAYYLRYGRSDGIEDWSGARKIRHAVLVNPPFGGSIKLARDFGRGSSTGFNDNLLSAEAIRSFTSPFQLLPRPDSTPIFDKAGKPFEINLFNIEVWERYRWGLFTTRTTEAAVREFREHLKRGESFVEYLNAPDLYPNTDLDHSVKLLNIQSRGEQTQTRCYSLPSYKYHLACNEDDLDSANSELDPNKLYEDGDGSVGLGASSLPEAFRDSLYTETKILSGEHLGVLDDSKARMLIFKFLNQGTTL